MINGDCYIFGAHSRSRTFGTYITALYPGVRILAYLIDNDEKNPDEVDGVPVFDIRSDERRDRLDKAYPVYLGTRGIYHGEISERLNKIGFKSEKIIPVTVDMDIMLRGRYVKDVFEIAGRPFCHIKDMDLHGESEDACLYVARSIFDSTLSESQELTDFEKQIHVGHALSDHEIEGCVFRDDEGDNISKRNRQFCELTGLYWIWKHAGERIIGFEHYRRHFMLPGSWTGGFDEGLIDVILPVPLYVAPSLKGNYIERHTDMTWDAMMEVLSRDPEVYEKADSFFVTNGCYSPCNMFIVRKNILDSLCSWLFPIIFEVADRVGELPDAYQNRYPGFLSERLISFYFYLHEKEYSVVYSDKNFLK